MSTMNPLTVSSRGLIAIGISPTIGIRLGNRGMSIALPFKLTIERNKSNSVLSANKVSIFNINNKVRI